MELADHERFRIESALRSLRLTASAHFGADSQITARIGRAYDAFVTGTDDATFTQLLNEATEALIGRPPAGDRAPEASPEEERAVTLKSFGFYCALKLRVRLLQVSLPGDLDSECELYSSQPVEFATDRNALNQVTIFNLEPPRSGGHFAAAPSSRAPRLATAGPALGSDEDILRSIRDQSRANVAGLEVSGGTLSRLFRSLGGAFWAALRKLAGLAGATLKMIMAGGVVLAALELTGFVNLYNVVNDGSSVLESFYNFATVTSFSDVASLVASLVNRILEVSPGAVANDVYDAVGFFVRDLAAELDAGVDALIPTLDIREWGLFNADLWAAGVVNLLEATGHRPGLAPVLASVTAMSLLPEQLRVVGATSGALLATALANYDRKDPRGLKQLPLKLYDELGNIVRRGAESFDRTRPANRKSSAAKVMEKLANYAAGTSGQTVSATLALAARDEIVRRHDRVSEEKELISAMGMDRSLPRDSAMRRSLLGLVGETNQALGDLPLRLDPSAEATAYGATLHVGTQQMFDRVVSSVKDDADEKVIEAMSAAHADRVELNPATYDKMRTISKLHEISSSLGVRNPIFGSESERSWATAVRLAEDSDNAWNSVVSSIFKMSKMRIAQMIEGFVWTDFSSLGRISAGSEALQLITAAGESAGAAAGVLSVVPGAELVTSAVGSFAPAASSAVGAFTGGTSSAATAALYAARILATFQSKRLTFEAYASAVEAAVSLAQLGLTYADINFDISEAAVEATHYTLEILEGVIGSVHDIDQIPIPPDATAADREQWERAVTNLRLAAADKLEPVTAKLRDLVSESRRFFRSSEALGDEVDDVIRDLQAAKGGGRNSRLYDVMSMFSRAYHRLGLDFDPFTPAQREFFMRALEKLHVPRQLQLRRIAKALIGLRKILQGEVEITQREFKALLDETNVDPEPGFFQRYFLEPLAVGQARVTGSDVPASTGSLYNPFATTTVTQWFLGQEIVDYSKFGGRPSEERRRAFAHAVIRSLITKRTSLGIPVLNRDIVSDQEAEDMLQRHNVRPEPVSSEDVLSGIEAMRRHATLKSPDHLRTTQTLMGAMAVISDSEKMLNTMILQTIADYEALDRLDDSSATANAEDETPDLRAAFRRFQKSGSGAALDKLLRTAQRADDNPIIERYVRRSSKTLVAALVGGAAASSIAAALGAVDYALLAAPVGALMAGGTVTRVDAERVAHGMTSAAGDARAQLHFAHRQTRAIWLHFKLAGLRVLRYGSKAANLITGHWGSRVAAGVATYAFLSRNSEYLVPTPYMPADLAFAAATAAHIFSKWIARHILFTSFVGLADLWVYNLGVDVTGVAGWSLFRFMAFRASFHFSLEQSLASGELRGVRAAIQRHLSENEDPDELVSESGYRTVVGMFKKMTDTGRRETTALFRDYLEAAKRGAVDPALARRILDDASETLTSADPRLAYASQASFRQLVAAAHEAIFTREWISALASLTTSHFVRFSKHVAPMLSMFVERVWGLEAERGPDRDPDARRFPRTDQTGFVEDAVRGATPSWRRSTGGPADGEPRLNEDLASLLRASVQDIALRKDPGLNRRLRAAFDIRKCRRRVTAGQAQRLSLLIMDDPEFM